MMHLTSVILLSIACWYTVSATTNSNDKNVKVSDLSINELTSIINSLVDKSLQQHQQQPQQAQFQQAQQQAQGRMLETIEDEAMPLEPLNSFNFYPSNLQMPDIIRPEKRGTFQFYGARGKKSSNGFNFGTMESKRFNYMPSRG
uniref:Uncharacterized protein n=1 Tax=Panagrolaimus sp. ES5 TaxID=591445 RepID=A0AC34F067_9BILA